MRSVFCVVENVELRYNGENDRAIGSDGMTTVVMRELVIGEGMPKICVPVVGRTLDGILAQVEALRDVSFDVMEWRADFYELVEDLDAVRVVLGEIRTVMPEKPLIFTFRSETEGGERMLCVEHYVALLKMVMASGYVDAVDVELFKGDAEVAELVTEAKKHDVKVVMSSHDFEKTPGEDEIVARLCKMQELGADLPKIAVMPHSAADVLTLLLATNRMVTEFADRPVITMSMAGLGLVSRLTGEIFGSALTFASVGEVSAPGQIEVETLRQALDVLHSNK